MTDQPEMADNQPPETPGLKPDLPPSKPDPTLDDYSPVAKASSDGVVMIKRTTINYVVIAIVFFAVGLLVGGMSFAPQVDGDVIENAVQTVLIDAGLMQEPADMEVMVDDDPFLGPEDAPVVIVEFSAYACPYCERHFRETLEPLLEEYGDYVRYVYRDFPSINANVSFPASLAANCANEQGQFWEYHDLLFTNQSAVVSGGSAYLNQLASDLGLDTESFSECLTQQDYIDEVNDDFDAGIAAGVSGTPAFYINGQAHSGARPFGYFEGIILRELDKAGIELEEPDA